MRVKLDYGAIAPTRAHETDAGLDLYSPHRGTVPAGGSKVIHTGVHVELPAGTAGVVISKSGLNVNHNLTSTGLIDEGYDGEIIVKLYNHGKTAYHFDAGDKVSQLVIIPVFCEPVEIVDSISRGERGSAGFGSTGR